MSNPNNALGTNGAYGGRTSVNAFNDVLASFESRGVLSGWACEPDSGLTVNLGGNGEERDVAIAEDNAGNKTTVNNISQAPVPVTIPSAPASNSRIDAIIAYIESSPSADGETDNYSAVNLLTVSGTASTSPTEPTDGDIRTAITADGASGPTAYYVVLAYITIPSGTTDIDATMISAGPSAGIGNKQIADGAVTADKIDFTTYELESRTQFLQNSESINDYTYTVPAGYALAFISIYIDISASEYSILLNNGTVSYTVANSRSQTTLFAKTGDVIKIRRVSGEAVSYHVGYIQKIF